MLAAVFGLVGVLIGGSLNIVGGLVLARRQDKREIRTAARLVMTEMEEIASKLRVHIALRTFPHDIPIRRWAENEALLARCLADDEWDALSGVYTSLRLFEDERTFELELAKDEGEAPAEWLPLDGDDLAHLKLTLDVVNDALEVVSRIAIGKPHAERLESALPFYTAYLDAERPSEQEPHDDDQ